MTYWALNAVFLTLVAAVVVAAVIRGHFFTRRAGNGLNFSAVGLTMIALLLMTAVFDNVMIGVGLVGYNEALISGVFVGIAPLEDFAYAVAAVVLLPALWSLSGARPSRQETPNVEHDAPQ
jgi:lycopene cyclase domain-containing protein